MTDQSVTQQRQQSALGFLHSALALLRKPKPKTLLIIADTANALEDLARASTYFTNLKALDGENALAVRGAVLEVAPKLADVLANEFSVEAVYSGLGSAAALATVEPDGFEMDRLHYTAMFAARLKITFHDRLLRDRGYPLARAIQFQRLMETPRLPEEPIN